MAARQGGFRILLGLALCALLTACGFALRGTTELPFDSVHINLSANSPFGAQLRRQLRATAPATRIVEDAARAEARLQILENTRDRIEVALNAQGRVQEYDLNLHVVFQVLDAQEHPLVPPTMLSATRTLAYDDNVAQAKEAEAQALYDSMQADIVQRILNRLAATDTRAAAALAEQERAHTPAPLVR